MPASLGLVGSGGATGPATAHQVDDPEHGWAARSADAEQVPPRRPSRAGGRVRGRVRTVLLAVVIVVVIGLVLAVRALPGGEWATSGSAPSLATSDFGLPPEQPGTGFSAGPGDPGGGIVRAPQDQGIAEPGVASGPTVTHEPSVEPGASVGTGSGETAEGETAEDGPASPDWWSVLAALDERRTAALEAVDRSALEGYAVRDSPMWRADSATIGALSDRGVRPAGLGTRVLAIESVTWTGVPSDELPDEGSDSNGGAAPAGAPTVELKVVDLRSGYDLLDAATGAVVDRVDPAGAARWLVRLVPTDGSAEGSSQDREPGWRVVAVLPVDEGGDAP